MGLAEFDPFISRVDGKGNITHIAGVKRGTSERPQWFPVDILKGNPNYSKLRKAAAREIMERFRDKWATFWQTADVQPDPRKVAVAFSPFSGGKVGEFLLDLIQYPKFITPDDIAYIGGIRFTGPLKPNRKLKLPKEDLAECSTDGGAFDYAVRQFANHVLWLGERLHCSEQAMYVHGRLCDLVKWLGTSSDINIASLDETLNRHDALVDALQSMCAIIAKHADDAVALQEAPPQTSPVISRDEFLRGLQRCIASRRISKQAQHLSDRKMLSIVARSAIYLAWKKFKTSDTDSLQNSKGHRWHSHTKRTYAGFLSFRAEDRLFTDPMTGYTVFLKDAVTNVADLAKIIHAETQRENERKAAEGLEKMRQRIAAKKAESPCA